MKVIIMLVLVPLVLICLGAFLFAGMKALFLRVKNNIKNKLSGKDSQPSPEAMMDIVTLTSGTCQSCGKKFIGTSEDKDPPLRVVTFMGESRVLCNDCLARIMTEFNSSHESQETRYSQNAMKLKELLSSTHDNKKGDLQDEQSKDG